MILAFTGHRPQRMSFAFFTETLKPKLIETLVDLQPKGCIIGMCKGFDVWVADVLHTQGIKYVAAIPFKQHMQTPNQDYHRILNNAHKVVIVSEGPYNPELYIIRDEYMVNKSDFLITGFDGGKGGGTFATILYATDKGKPIKHLWKGI